jgi:hypothetical protein
VIVLQILLVERGGFTSLGFGVVHCVYLVYGGLGVYGTRRVIFAHVVIHQLLSSAVIQTPYEG